MRRDSTSLVSLPSSGSHGAGVVATTETLPKSRKTSLSVTRVKLVGWQRLASEWYKTVMNFSLAMLAYIGARKNDEARSALPDAPVVMPRDGGVRGRVDRLRGRVASFLHRAAWAIEPAPRDLDWRP
jgi:hypothetical protein